MRNETKKIDNKVLRFTIGSIWTNLQSYSMDDIVFDSQDGRSSLLFSAVQIGSLLHSFRVSIFRDQAIQKIYLTLEDETDTLYCNVGKETPTYAA